MKKLCGNRPLTAESPILSVHVIFFLELTKIGNCTKSDVGTLSKRIVSHKELYFGYQNLKLHFQINVDKYKSSSLFLEQTLIINIQITHHITFIVSNCC